MDEVEVGVVLYAREQRRVLPLSRFVPAHVRHLEAGPFREAHNPALYNTQTPVEAELHRFVEQELQAQADAEEGLAALDRLHYRIDEAVVVQVPHAVLERADAGEHDVARVKDGLGVACDRYVRADPLKCLGNAPQVAHVIVDYGYHLKLKLALCGEHPFNPRVYSNRRAERAAKGLVDRLYRVVDVIAVVEGYVQVEPRAVRERLHELLHEPDIEGLLDRALFQGRIDVVDRERGDGRAELEVGPVAYVEYHCRERVHHRHVGGAAPLYPGVVAERLLQGLSERYADVLDRVVEVDLDVSLCPDLQVKEAVAREVREHVVEERERRLYVAISTSVEVDLDGYLRLPCLPGYLCLTGHLLTYRYAVCAILDYISGKLRSTYI